MAYVRRQLPVSERRACRVIGHARSTHRHADAVPADEPRLVDRMIELATTYGRYGYRRITGLRRGEGWLVNHKRVERLWRRKGLKAPQKQPKRGRLWSIDVLETLAELFVTYGVPAHIRSACYEQVVKALGAVGPSNRGTDTGSGSVEPAHRASSGLIPEERRVPGGSTSSCLRREGLRTTVGMASSPVGAGASGFYAAIDSSLHTWSASNAVRFLTTANASCSSLVMQAPIACIGGRGRVTRCVRRS